MRFLLVLVLVCVSFTAHAEQLRVAIIVPASSAPLEYRLSEPDSRIFWQRWQKLPRSTQMVPLSAGGNYSGLRIFNQERQIRLFNGIGTQGQDSRSDDLRLLERWVLSKAPPPFGPALLAELDRSVDALALTEKVQSPKPKAVADVIIACRARGTKNQQLRALCLEDALKDRLDWRSYANGLEKILSEQ